MGKPGDPAKPSEDARDTATARPAAPAHPGTSHPVLRTLPCAFYCPPHGANVWIKFCRGSFRNATIFSCNTNAKSFISVHASLPFSKTDGSIQTAIKHPPKTHPAWQAREKRTRRKQCRGNALEVRRATLAPMSCQLRNLISLQFLQTMEPKAACFSVTLISNPAGATKTASSPRLISTPIR